MVNIKVGKKEFQIVTHGDVNEINSSVNKKLRRHHPCNIVLGPLIQSKLDY